MSHQNRSASVSHTPNPGNEHFRLSSFGNTSLFNNLDPSSFFDSSEESPLDIVDTLATLNIDDVADASPSNAFDDSSLSHASQTSQTSQVAPVEVTQDLAKVSNTSKLASSVLKAHASLTPNPPHMSAFMPAHGAPNTITKPDSTPSSKWGNTFVPFSAPPYAYTVADPLLTSQMAMQIAPFALPDEKPDLNYKSDTAHLATASPQPSRQFGGILNLRLAFDSYVPQPETGDISQFLPKNTSLADSNSSEEGGAEKNQPEFSEMSFYSHLDAPLDVFTSPPILSGMNLWNQKQFYPVQNASAPFIPGSFSGADSPNHMDSRGGAYTPNPHPFRASVNNVSSQTNQNQGSGTPNTSNISQAYQTHSHHTHHSHHAHNHAAHPVNNAHNHGSSQGLDGSNDGYYNRRQNDYMGMNSRVNIHRKMHSNRKKGDMAAKYANATLEDFTGDIYSLCKDQHGCRFLQRQLDLSKENKTPEAGDIVPVDVAATMIFNEIHTKIVELMVDPFGNYLVQKLFESVSASQRLVLIRCAAPEFIRIALDPHGTRALQKLVEQVLSSKEAQYIIDSLSPHVVSLSRDLNGNHVVQKCLQRLNPADNQFIFDTASQSCAEIATHRHGCCVLQRCLDHGNSKQREQLSLKVAEIATTLSLDPYGNYVVQYVLSRGDDRSIAIILDHIRVNIISLSLHKFGSNVIEKTLRTRRLSDSVIDVLLENSSQLSVLLNDPYGNYVLQTALDVATATHLNRLAQTLQPLLPNIKNTPHGRRIFTKIQHIL